MCHKVQELETKIITSLVSDVVIKKFGSQSLLGYSQQYQFTTWCPMDFTHYPFDRQVSETLEIKTSREFSP